LIDTEYRSSLAHVGKGRKDEPEFCRQVFRTPRLTIYRLAGPNSVLDTCPALPLNCGGSIIHWKAEPTDVRSSLPFEKETSRFLHSLELGIIVLQVLENFAPSRRHSSLTPHRDAQPANPILYDTMSDFNYGGTDEESAEIKKLNAEVV
jgi:hypothetical protein